MKSPRVLFEAKDAELLWRAARIGLRSLAVNEKPRTELALKRLKALEIGMKQRDTDVVELVTERLVYRTHPVLESQ